MSTTLQFVDKDISRRALKKLIDRSVKHCRLEYEQINNNETAIVPIIVMPHPVFKDLISVDGWTRWQSIATTDNIHLFSTVKTAEHEWLFHFEAQNKDHLKWLVWFYKTSINDPFDSCIEQHNTEGGYIGVTGPKESDRTIYIPSETKTVGNAIIRTQMMSDVRSGITPRGRRDDGC